MLKIASDQVTEIDKFVDRDSDIDISLLGCGLQHNRLHGRCTYRC